MCECSLSVHSMFPECSLNAHSMFTQCSLNVHSMFTQCSPPGFGNELPRSSSKSIYASTQAGVQPSGQPRSQAVYAMPGRSTRTTTDGVAPASLGPASLHRLPSLKRLGSTNAGTLLSHLGNICVRLGNIGPRLGNICVRLGNIRV